MHVTVPMRMGLELDYRMCKKNNSSFFILAMYFEEFDT